MVSAVDKGELEAERALAKVGDHDKAAQLYLVPLPRVPAPLDLKHPACFLRLIGAAADAVGATDGDKAGAGAADAAMDCD